MLAYRMLSAWMNYIRSSFDCPYAYAGEVPTLSDMSLMEWTENGKEKELRLLQLVAPQWKDLGTDGFGMQGHELQILEDKFSVVESCRNLLQKFVRSGSTKIGMPSWRGLIKALNKAQLKDAADKLQTALPQWHDQRT